MVLFPGKKGFHRMFSRLLTLPTKHHAFIFGARNTGKSTLITQTYQSLGAHYFDLLDLDLEYQLQNRPNALYEMVKALPTTKPYILIDEIQKIPALLNVVHRLTKDKDRYFIMTGSSAKKLKREGVNLLAGRAFVYHLFPLSYREIGEQFNLDQALHWGSYAHTYLKEEIGAEQFVKDLMPFRRFLEVAAQCNGKIINYAAIARDTHLDEKTVKAYFLLLEDTLIGYMLESYHGSLRKRVHSKPKFYFFDTGIVRALAQHLSVPLLPSTHAYGNAFEHFFINECITVTDQEIDLIIERPGQTTLLFEIKSTREVYPEMLKPLILLKDEVPNAEACCVSNDPYAKKIGNIRVLPWQQALEFIFEI